MRLHRHCLVLHPLRCDFAMPQAEYLGHVISEKGIKQNPAKVRAVLEFPVPISVKTWDMLSQKRVLSKTQLRLEQCWNSLSQFQQRQLGSFRERLAITLGLYLGFLR